MQNKPIVLVLAHCLFNPKVRAKGLAQHPEIKKKILKIAKEYDTEIQQLPCPEFLFFGEREPKTYDEYIETIGFKDLCEKLAEDAINNLKKFGDCLPLFSPSSPLFSLENKEGGRTSGIQN